MDPIKSSSNISNLFEAFGFGAMSIIIVLWDAGLTFDMLGTQEQLPNLLGKFSDYSLLLVALFIFISYTTGRIIMLLGESVSSLLDLIVSSPYFPTDSEIYHAHVDDRTWIKITSIRKDIYFFQGLFGLTLWLLLLAATDFTQGINLNRLGLLWIIALLIFSVSATFKKRIEIWFLLRSCAKEL